MAIPFYFDIERMPFRTWLLWSISFLLLLLAYNLPETHVLFTGDNPGGLLLTILTFIGSPILAALTTLTMD